MTPSISDSLALSGLHHAYQAALDSPDPSTQNGALIFTLNHGSVVGFNGPPHGVPYDPEWSRDRRMPVTEHAERAAIYAAARCGMRLDGATMFCPWAACADCARAITATGISRLVRHREAMDRTPERWRASIAAAEEILEAASVEVVTVSARFGGVQVRRDGELWEP